MFTFYISERFSYYQLLTFQYDFPVRENVHLYI